MTVIEKYLEYKKQEALKMYCPLSFPFLKKGIKKPLNPETCEGEMCKSCWESEITEADRNIDGGLNDKNN